MTVYIDTRFFKKAQVEALFEAFKELTFITNLDEATEAEVAIVTPPFVNQENINRFTKLKMIQLLTAGFDNADVSYAQSKNIIVANAQDVFSIQIAEDIISKILVFNRQLKGQIKHMEEGLWKHIPVKHELYGSTVGVIGAGSIGRETAKRLKPFETHIIGYRQKNEAVPYIDEIFVGKEGLVKVLTESDYIVVSIPLNQNTHHLLSNEMLKHVKKDAVIINVARGEIIDQDALVKLLETNNIRGVGLDVTTPEPLPQEHPLWKFPNVIITPHNASASPLMAQRLYQVVFDNLKQYINDQPLKYLI